MGRLIALAACLLVLLPASASAWVPNQTCNGGNTAITWPSESTTWKLRDKLGGANNFYSGLADTAVINAVTGGWTVWENPSTCGSAWTANYGAFQESILSVKCTYRGEVGYFAPVVFLNSRSSIPAGREIYGTPKVYADVQVGFDERVMHTDTLLAGTSALSIRSTMHREARVEDMPEMRPAWRLKVIPRADGQGADVLQLLDAGDATADVTVHVCRQGDGVVQFNPVPTYDLSDFTPREYLGAYYLEMDYTENYATIVHDFLAADDYGH